MKNFKKWRDVIAEADKVVKDDNFITAFVDGEGIGTAARNSNDWAFLPMGAETWTGAKLTPDYYAELKAKA